MRFGPPAPRDGRLEREDRALGGQGLRRGDFGLCSIAAASSDPRALDRPTERQLDPEENRAPAHGRGIHVCLGARRAGGISPARRECRSQPLRRRPAGAVRIDPA